METHPSNEAYGKSDSPFGPGAPGFSGEDDLEAAGGFRRAGVDVVSVERIRGLLHRHGDAFLERFFTPHERRACREGPSPARRLALCWGMREAGFKAIGGGRLWTDYRVDFRGGRPTMDPASSLYERPDVDVPPVTDWWTRCERTEAWVLVAAVAIWPGTRTPSSPEGGPTHGS